MNYMNEEQVKLLHKLQMVGIPAFAMVNPLAMDEDQTRDFLRMNLPPLEWIDAVGETKNHEFVEQRFIGVSENNCKIQMREWLEKENLRLFQTPNPQFGTGEMWLEYFSLPMESVNLKALEELFHKWEIPIPQIPIPAEQQKIEHYKPKVAEQEIFQRLSSEELLQELESLNAGKELSPGVSLGFSPADMTTFEEDTTFHTFLSPLDTLSPAELELLANGKTVDNLTGQLCVDTVHSNVSRKPYYTRLSSEEVKQEIEHFQHTGSFRVGISIGYDNGIKTKSDKSIEAFVTELSDKELDQLESGRLAHPEKLRGQKLLGYTVSHNVKVFRRMTPEELADEIKYYAENKRFSSPEINIGRIPGRESHKKEFHRPLLPLSEQDLKALAVGKPIKNRDILLAQKLICRTPEIPPAPVYETKFSAIELAFDDCGEERVELYIKHRKALDEKAFNKIDPEQRAVIKTLQSTGKGPKIDREAYLSFTKRDAAAYIHENGSNPDNTFSPTIYPQRSSRSRKEAFPEFKEVNLLSCEQADYLQRSIIRDLATEGHIATPKTLPELLDKIEFITTSQAKEIIEPYLKTPAGSGLLTQAGAYIRSGKISSAANITTIADVCKLYQTHRGLNFDMKAALRDLIDGGYIQTRNALDKIKFTTAIQDEALIAKYGDAPIGNNLRSKIYNLINDARIGNMDDEQFSRLNISEALRLIAGNAELERFKNQSPASKGQKELLKKMEARGSVDLKKIDMQQLSFKAADQLIKKNIHNSPPYQSNNASATFKQRALIRVLVEHELLTSMPYAEWKALTIQNASDLISSVPEEKRQELSSRRSESFSPSRQSMTLER
ncbi:MAG: hypothetical protein JXR78_04675 [Victivallales bacterium]|nr:hypothetical protein [Victivallales bacterium]